MTWHIVHPHDYFIAGVCVGVLFSCWVFVLVMLYLEARKPKERGEIDLVRTSFRARGQ